MHALLPQNLLRGVLASLFSGFITLLLLQFKLFCTVSMRWNYNVRKTTYACFNVKNAPLYGRNM